ncbi:MAG: DUF1173 family protein [Rhodocyclaceae bacterium]|nr:DUF1173 family protein [Rhodocyclaceae bacterium]
MQAAPSQRISIGGQAHLATWLMMTPAGQRALAAAHQQRLQLRCLCVGHGVDMYVARRGTTFYLARMPGTGMLHAEDCPSAEGANLFSGADSYLAGAMTESPDGRLSVQYADGGPVSIEGLLDLMIEMAELNVLRPDAGQRTWRDARKALAEGAEDIITPDGSLAAQILLPHAFNKDSYATERVGQEAFLTVPDCARLVCAPLRELRPTAYGWRVILKHMPDTRFWLSRTVAESLVERAAGTFNPGAPPLPSLALMRVKQGGKPGEFRVSDIALRRTDRRFMPCLSEQEAQVADELSAARRALLRPLRFDAPWPRALADYALLDCAGAPLPVLVLAPTGSEALDLSKRFLAGALRHRSDFPCSVWERTGWSSPPPEAAAVAN